MSKTKGVNLRVTAEKIIKEGNIWIIYNPEDVMVVHNMLETLKATSDKPIKLIKNVKNEQNNK